MKKELKFDEIKKGIRVKDSDGDIGTVSEIEDIYNVGVVFDNGGYGYFCINECCKDKLYLVNELKG